jgi:adenosylhomocysteinase
MMDWPGGETANMILDDGGDATMLVSSAPRPRPTRRFWSNPGKRGGGILFATIKKRLAKDPTFYSRIRAAIRGVSEETTTGVMRLYQLQQKGELPFPAINVNDSVTKSKFDNKYGTRESLVDAIRRGTDVMMAGKVAIVCGYGDVGKGSAQSLRGAGRPRARHRSRPDLRAAGRHGRLRGGDARGRGARADIVVTATGNKDVVTLDDIRKIKDMAIVCNIGHFDNEIQVAALRNFKWTNVKPQVDLIDAPGKRIVLLSEGRLVNLGNATGHPSFVMSGLVLQPDAGADRTLDQRQTSRTRCTCCPSISTRRSPRCTSPSSAPS